MQRQPSDGRHNEPAVEDDEDTRGGVCVEVAIEVVVLTKGRVRKMWEFLSRGPLLDGRRDELHQPLCHPNQPRYLPKVDGWRVRKRNREC